MATMGEVLGFFQEVTGEEFYPNPSKFFSDPDLKLLTDQVDDLIAIQAKERRQAHRTAQLDTAVELVPEAHQMFEKIKRRSQELRKGVSVSAD